MAENVRVLVRCRPMNRKEESMNCKNIVQIKDCVVRLNNPTDPAVPAKTFTYDNAYADDAPTEAIYNDICYSLVENVLEGYNGTIFAYGQTGCGKSHTMQGPESVTTAGAAVNVAPQRGIISRSFDHIFEAIAVTTGVRYLALVSYLEIYNENIRDLLNPGVNSSHLQLKEIPGEGVFVQNLSTHAVHNSRECDDLLNIGSANRVVGSTLMNAGSSRSHSIFTISLEQIQVDEQNDNDEDGGSTVAANTTITPPTGGIRKGKLNLVDLAGSERQTKTGATGDRLKEATKINLSLSALGNVISALVDGKTRHIPYRDSKLTRLLQDSLGGNTKTLMIACISPADYNYDETLSTLRYASRAKSIHNKPIINEDPKDAMLREYQQEILQLRKLLENGGGNGVIPMATTADSHSREQRQKWLDTERAKLRAEYENETARMKSEHTAQQKEKEDLVRSMERLKLHYEEQLRNLVQNTSGEINNNSLGKQKVDTILDANTTILDLASQPAAQQRLTDVIQQEALNRIETIKNALIGGERANDTQFKEHRIKRKLAAQRRISALAQVLSRVEQSADRDLLQEHYSDIQHELKVKTDALKQARLKMRALEREVSDLQSEFQLDRADYLETIRRLEKNFKFYQQLLEKALPILRKDGKYWDIDAIQAESEWNDDTKKWRLLEDIMHRVRLPPASGGVSANGKLPNAEKPTDEAGSLDETTKMPNGNDQDIANHYFRPKRIVELVHQRKGFNNWKEFTTRNRQPEGTSSTTPWLTSKSARRSVTISSPSTSPPPVSGHLNIRHPTSANLSTHPLLHSIHKTWSDLTEELIANGGGSGLSLLNSAQHRRQSNRIDETSSKYDVLMAKTIDFFQTMKNREQLNRKDLPIMEETAEEDDTQATMNTPQLPVLRAQSMELQMIPSLKRRSRQLHLHYQHRKANT